MVFTTMYIKERNNMRLFRKTLKRLQSLEEELGVVFVRKDGWEEHQTDSDAYGRTFQNRLKAVEDFIKDIEKKEK